MLDVVDAPGGGVDEEVFGEGFGDAAGGCLRGMIISVIAEDGEYYSRFLVTSTRERG